MYTPCQNTSKMITKHNRNNRNRQLRQSNASLRRLALPLSLLEPPENIQQLVGRLLVVPSALVLSIACI